MNRQKNHPCNRPKLIGWFFYVRLLTKRKNECKQSYKKESEGQSQNKYSSAKEDIMMKKKEMLKIKGKIVCTIKHHLMIGHHADVLTKDEKGIAFDKNVKMSEVINGLTFKLTKAQLKVLEEIDYDMEKEKPMNRLLQGDVGSRKNNSCTYCSI